MKKGTMVTREEDDNDDNTYEPNKQAKTPAFPDYGKWDVDMSKMSKEDDTECNKKSKWMLDEANAGLHMHFEKENYKEPEGKIMAKCSASRPFKSEGAEKQVYMKWNYNDSKMEGNNKLWVRSGMNVYNSAGTAVDMRSSDWQLIVIQTESGATYGAVASMAALAAGAALLSF